MEWNVPITPPGGSLLHWYELKGDPEDVNNLIVCGARRDAQNDAYYGVVYFSHDGGRSWKTAFEDHREHMGVRTNDAHSASDILRTSFLSHRK